MIVVQVGVDDDRHVFWLVAQAGQALLEVLGLDPQLFFQARGDGQNPPGRC